jgi:hypothetical protein
VEGGLKTNNMIYIIVTLLIVTSLVHGFSRYNEIDFALEINLFRSPYFLIGLSYTEFILDDGNVERELRIGFFFVNISVLFWIDNQENDA